MTLVQHRLQTVPGSLDPNQGLGSSVMKKIENLEHNDKTLMENIQMLREALESIYLKLGEESKVIVDDHHVSTTTMVSNGFLT